jgi:hypothetical protein
MRTTINFTEVKLQGRKTSKCVVCGKRRSRSKTFWQTLNPFNKKADGSVKSRRDIMEELRGKIKLWEKEPINCCE